MTAPSPAARVIYLNMIGGLSHIDTFDVKPESPDVQGPVRAINTNVAGVRVSEFLPRLANLMDRTAIIRSMTSNQGDHPAAQYLLHRSYLQGGTISHPTLAAWALRSLGKINPELPGSVSIAGNDDSVSTGFLESQFAPVPIGDPLQGLPNSRRAARVNDAQLSRRLKLSQALNLEFRAHYKSRQTDSHADMFAEAVRLMKSRDLQAFDVAEEPDSLRTRYGASSFGQGCLLARRLAEHGVRFVEVGLDGWDSHYDNFVVVGEKAVIIDQAISALLTDLEQRGMLEDTLVVVGTEFGRTPAINPAHKNGRDHHPKAFSCLLAGGGVQGGQVYGSTDAQGAEVVDRAVAIPDFNATIAWALGLPIEEKIADPSGQLFQIADNGRPVKELFGVS